MVLASDQVSPALMCLCISDRSSGISWFSAIVVDILPHQMQPLESSSRANAQSIVLHNHSLCSAELVRSFFDIEDCPLLLLL